MASKKRQIENETESNEDSSHLRKTKLMSEVITSPWGLKKSDHLVCSIQGVIDSSSYSSTPRIEQFTRLSFPTVDEEHGFDIYTSYMTFPTTSMLPPECINSIQQNLVTEIQALKRMTIKEDRMGNTSWQIIASEIPNNELCQSLVHAFLYNMDANDGKTAISMLLNRIVTDLHLPYTVRQTGFSGSPSQYSTCVKMEYTVESSACSPNNEQKSYKPKFLTPDIIVFKQDNWYKAPLTKLLISVKSGFKDRNGQQLIAEMLSRMQYQDSICGLEINSAKSVIYKVQKTKPYGGGGKSGKVHILTYPPYIFIKHNEPFALEKFYDMLLDVVYVLYEEQ